MNSRRMLAALAPVALALVLALQPAPAAAFLPAQNPPWCAHPFH